MYSPATGKQKPVEQEVITEENVFERPDETIAFFPTQVLYDLFVWTLLILAKSLHSEASPARLTEPADTAPISYVPRRE